MNALEKQILKEQIDRYLAEQYEPRSIRYSLAETDDAPVPDDASTFAVRAVRAFLRERADRETFSDRLLRIIRERGLRESDVYNSVFMDRTLFSKIRSDPHYQPSKRTAILLALALRLPLAEAQELLGKAGYRLSASDRGDLIVEYFISQGRYNVLDINEMLAEFHAPLLLKDH